MVENQSNYTFEEGDTFYNISLAVNIKWQKLMELNGFEEGSQYNVPVGTIISFDGLKVNITDSQGKVVSEAQLTPADKADPSQTIGQQVTVVPSDTKRSTTTVPYNLDNTVNVPDKNISTSPGVQSTPAESPVLNKDGINSKKNELKDLEDKRDALEKEKEELEKAKQEVEEAVTDTINQSNEWQVSALTSQKSALTQRNNGLQNDLEQSLTKLQAIDGEFTQAQSVKNDLDNQLLMATTVYQAVQQKVEELKAQQAVLESQIANCPEDQVEQRKELESQLATVVAMLEVANNSGSQLTELNEQITQLDNRIKQLISEKETKQTKVNQLQVELSQAQEQLAILNVPDNEKGKTKQEALEKQQQLAAYSQKIDAIDTQIDQLDAKIATLSTEIETLEKNGSNEKATLDEIQSKLLSDAQVAATTTIQTFEHLSLNEKESFILQVKNVTTNQQVLTVYSNAAEAQALIVFDKDRLKTIIKAIGSKSNSMNSKLIIASKENDLLNEIDSINNIEELTNFEQTNFPLFISQAIRKVCLVIFGVDYSEIVQAYTDSATVTLEDSRNLLKNVYEKSLIALLTVSPLKSNIDLWNYFNNTNALLWLTNYELANKYSKYSIAADFRAVFSDIVNVLTKP